MFEDIREAKVHLKAWILILGEGFDPAGMAMDVGLSDGEVLLLLDTVDSVAISHPFPFCTKLNSSRGHPFLAVGPKVWLHKKGAHDLILFTKRMFQWHVLRRTD